LPAAVGAVYSLRARASNFALCAATNRL
jgi:hypothetical protein